MATRNEYKYELNDSPVCPLLSKDPYLPSPGDCLLRETLFGPAGGYPVVDLNLTVSTFLSVGLGGNELITVDSVDISVSEASSVDCTCE